MTPAGLPATAPAGLASSTRALLLVGVLLHLGLAATLELSPDEAHYALYGAHPAWSYFDHPPLVGWLQWIFVQLGGGDVLMRVVPMACWVAAALATVALCRELVPAAPHDPVSPDPGAARRRDDWAVALMLVSPLLDVLGVALVPDSLLLPLTPMAMRATWRLRTPQDAGEPGRWWTLGAVLGACVLAKYTSALLLAGALGCLFAFHGRRLVARPGFWIVVACVSLAALPVLGWNLLHGGRSLAYQAGHVAGRGSWSGRDVARMVAGQVGAYGVLLAAGALAALRGRGRSSPSARGLALAFGLPVLVVALASSGRGGSLPHWTACGWMALVPLAVDGCLRARGRWPPRVALVQAVLVLALFGLIVAGGPQAERDEVARAGPGGAAGEAPNPAADTFGWRDAAGRAAGLAAQHGVDALAVMNWSLAGRIAWYARPWPVRVIPPHEDQFALWFGTLRPGESVLVVDWSRLDFPAPQGPQAFARCRALDQMPVRRAGRQIAHFNFLLCEDWQGPTGAGGSRAGPVSPPG